MLIGREAIETETGCLRTATGPLSIGREDR